MSFVLSQTKKQLFSFKSFYLSQEWQFNCFLVKFWHHFASSFILCYSTCVTSVSLPLIVRVWIICRAAYSTTGFSVHIVGGVAICKVIMALTDKNSGNESKIRLTSKILPFYTHIFTNSIFDQKTREFKQFSGHPQTIFLCRIKGETCDLMKETDPI